MPLPGSDWTLFQGQGLRFEFEFLYTGADKTNLNVTIHLTDEYGNLVFVGGSGNLPPQHFGYGVIKAACEVPADIMHHGFYTISKLLLVRNRGSVVLAVPNAVSFEIVPKPHNPFGWMGRKEGVVKPNLNWQLTYDSHY